MGSLFGGIVFVFQVIGNLLLNIFKFPATKIKVLFVWERGKIKGDEIKEIEKDNIQSLNIYSFKKDGTNES